MRYAKIAIALLVIIMTSNVFANPPSAIYADYDSTRHELNVKAQHIVTKRAEHFVKRVVIYKNGKEVLTKTFDFQTSHRNQTMPPISLDAKKSDKIRIVAFCNISGSYEKTLVIEQ